MYKIYTRNLGWLNRHARTLLLTMKLITIILFTTFMQVSAFTYAQKLNFTQKNASLEQVFRAIKKQTGYTVFWSSNSLIDKKLDVDFKDVSLDYVMKKCLEGQELNFTIKNNTIVIREYENESPSVIDELMNYFKRINVIGKVTDEQGKALAGATISVIGKEGQSVIADAEGRYRLSNIEEDATVSFSYIGFKTKEIRLKDVKNKEQVNVVLVSDVSDLEDVVVVGYGTTKRKDLVGSVSTINGDDMRKQQATNFTQALVARSAGVQVSRPNGNPGASASIRIRGLSTVMGVNEPLYVIDGIPIQLYNGGGVDALRYTVGAGLMDPLAGIDMNDVENVEILKDATATAIYGSRAAYGVIMVTTKKGKAGYKPVFSVNYDVTTDKQAKFHDVLSGPEYVKFITELYAANGQKLSPSVFPGDGNTDWQRAVSKTGIVHNLNLSLLGATKDNETNYGFSAGLTDQKGIMIRTGFKRYSVRANVESKVFDIFKIGTNLNFSSSQQTGGASQIYNNNDVAVYRPDVPIFSADGTYATKGSDNPVATRQNTNIRESQRLLASVFAELEIVPGLKARSAIAYDLNTNVAFSYTPSWLISQKDRNQKGSRGDRLFKYTNRVFDNTLTFTRSFNEHHIDAVAGASWTLNRSNNQSIGSINFPNDDVLNNLGSAALISSYSSGGDASGLESYFLRTNYNYKGKYYLSLTGRADNSTKFGPGNQWGYFPSVGVAWRFSQEKFMEGLSFLDDAKLRMTVGKVGSSAFGSFGFLTLFNTGFSYNGVNGLRANPDNGMPNPDIHWESTVQTDVALELSFLKSRLRTSFNYYRKYTEGLITGPGIPVSTGFTYQVQNIGDVSNRGLEITVSGIPVHNKNFNWLSDFNISFNRNRVEKTYGTSLYGTISLIEGLPLNGILGYRTNGLYQEKAEIDELNRQARLKTGNPSAFYQLAETSPGDVRYVDVNGDGVINSSDRQILGYSQNPKFYGGWNNTFRYKSFELSSLFQFDVGSKIQREANLDIYTGYSRNVSPRVLNAWTPENRNTNQPRNSIRLQSQNIDTKTDRFIDDSSFLRLKSVQLSYVLQDAFLKKMYVRQVRLFCGMTNLLTWTKYRGLDPETNSENSFTDHGRDTGVYPQARSVTFGANFKF